MDKMCSVSPPASEEEALAARIDAILAPFYKANDPGATVIVTLDGKTVFRQAYGMASIVEQQAMLPETTLRLGSISKQFTAVAILMLVEEGKLSVSDKISQFLSDYPAQGRQITIEHLLTHSSGIVSFTGKEGFDANITKELSIAQMIDSFKDDPLEFAPGTAFNYNNSGYFLLGTIIEKLSGMSYAKYVQRHIFVPLGMSNTYYEGYELSPQRTAAGHTYRNGAFVPCDAISMSQVYAAGALVSNVDDMARWENAVASGKLISVANWTKAFTPYRLANGNSCGYGYGWEVRTLQQRPMLAHGGGINGFMTFALRLPEDKLFVAVLSNADFGVVDPECIAHKIGAVTIGEPLVDFEAIELDATALDAFVGVYTINALEQRIFWRDANQLLMQRAGGDITPVHAYSGNGFFIKNTLGHMEFVRDAAGVVVKVVVHHGGAADENLRVTA
ncbi:MULTISPECIES: serine hydrolase domain-containing protein [unclassified Janthinobacterium]|uniref:serine hydrolase domain-containing protein n=1 Tax=unclassified Janthinobacterium TaxID=2610881 RepID=UPI000377A364|nr:MULTISPECIES: serine hydrolase domain-containing protein [unclassified Janthinobacterium]MEC5159565.1 D-alanyl-D-alanine carboxypeptidase [Janthinobacterium sp. CG_S6]